MRSQGLFSFSPQGHKALLLFRMVVRTWLQPRCLACALIVQACFRLRYVWCGFHCCVIVDAVVDWFVLVFSAGDWFVVVAAAAVVQLLVARLSVGIVGCFVSIIVGCCVLVAAVVDLFVLVLLIRILKLKFNFHILPRSSYF
jgi:hypothetical protein